jgi:hypothetical protein
MEDVTASTCGDMMDLSTDILRSWYWSLVVKRPNSWQPV